MKTKIVIIAENDASSEKAISELDKDNVENINKIAWNIILADLYKNSHNNVRAYVESCELLDD